MPSETYAKNFKDSMLSRFRYGKVERLEYYGRTLNNVAGEIFIEGKSNQRIYFPAATVAIIQVVGCVRDTSGTPLNETFSGTIRVARQVGGNAAITGATAVLVGADGTTAYTKMTISVTNPDEVRFTYTGAASSGSNVVHMRLNVVSVSTDADVLAN